MLVMECLTEWMNKRTNRHKLWEGSAVVFCSKFPWKIITALHLAVIRKQGGCAGPDVGLLRGHVCSSAHAQMPYLPLPGLLLSGLSKPHFSHLFGEGIEWDHFYLKRRYSARLLVNTHSVLACVKRYAAMVWSDSGSVWSVLFSDPHTLWVKVSCEALGWNHFSGTKSPLCLSIFRWC